MSTQIFKFIIDTDSYSGNFEREMCAYMTGATHEYGRGEYYSECFRKDFNFISGEKFEDENNPFIDLIEWNTEDESPCSTFDTPGRLNDGMGNFYDQDADIKEVTARYRESYRKLYEDYNNEEYKEKMENGIPGAFGACESVAIFMNSRPTDKQIKILKQRAYAFPSIWKSKGNDIINILGLRLIKQITVIKLIEEKIT